MGDKYSFQWDLRQSGKKKVGRWVGELSASAEISLMPCQRMGAPPSAYVREHCRAPGPARMLVWTQLHVETLARSCRRAGRRLVVRVRLPGIAAGLFRGARAEHGKEHRQDGE